MRLLVQLQCEGYLQQNYVIFSSVIGYHYIYLFAPSKFRHIKDDCRLHLQ